MLFAVIPRPAKAWATLLDSEMMAPLAEAEPLKTVGAARRAGRLLLKLNGATVDPPASGSSRSLAKIPGRWSPAVRPTRNAQMKFMFIVKSDHTVAPTPALLEAMHKLADREIKAGRMLDNGGLTPMAQGERADR